MSGVPLSRPATATDSGPARLRRTGALAALVVLGLSYLLNAMDQQVIVVLPAVREDLGYSPAQNDLLTTICTLGIGVAGLLTGYLLDRLSRRAVMVIGIAIFSLFTVLTTAKAGFGDVLVHRAMTGVGGGMQNTALFSAVGAYFVASRALALGSLSFVHGLGGVLGPLLGAYLVVLFGAWRAPFLLYGAAGAVLLIAVALVSKRFTEQVETAAPQVGRAGHDRIPYTLYNRNLLLLAGVAVVVGLSMHGYVGLYPTFLREQLGFSWADATLTAGMFGLGALAGLPAGWLGDRLDQRKIMICALLAGSVVGYLLFNGPTSLGAQRAVRPAMVGRASGLCVASIFIPASVAGYVFSGLVAATGWSGAALWQLGVLPIVAVALLLGVDTQRFSHARAAPRS